MADGRFELAMEPMAIGLVSLNSNSETHINAICDAWLIYGSGGFHGYLYAVHNCPSYHPCSSCLHPGSKYGN